MTARFPATTSIASAPELPRPEDDEASAIRRVRNGDYTAIDQLYDRHAANLLRLSLRLCGSRHDAEDVVHDVFAALPKALRRYEHRGRFDAWLRTLVINRVTDRERAKRRRRERSIDAALDHAAPSGDDTIDAGLERAIAALPESLRLVFVLRAVEGYSHEEIGRTLGIRSGTSEVRYFRAIRQLRQVLGDPA